MLVDSPVHHGCGGYRRKLGSLIKIKEWVWESGDVVAHGDSLCITLPFFNSAPPSCLPFLWQPMTIVELKSFHTYVLIEDLFQKQKAKESLHPKIP